MVTALSRRDFAAMPNNRLAPAPGFVILNVLLDLLLCIPILSVLWSWLLASLAAWLNMEPVIIEGFMPDHPKVDCSGVQMADFSRAATLC